MPTDLELAERYLHVYDHPEAYFPNHAELARKEFALFEGLCRGLLGHTSMRYPHASPTALRARGHGFNYPTLIGMIMLPSAGLLFPGEPERAYIAAFEASFAGAESFPAELIETVVTANRAVYGFDLEDTLRRWLAACGKPGGALTTDQAG